MRVSLINVQISEGNNIVPPLGILYIAAVLEQQGHEVQVFDVDPDVAPCVEQIQAFAPQIVGLGCYTNTYPKARRLTARLREACPRAVLVCGGVHATAKPLETIQELRADYLVYAEGERSMARLVRCLETGAAGDIENIKGLYYWKDGQVKYTGAPELIEDLDSIPFPARHLLRYEPYLAPPGMIRGYALERLTTLFTSRGCPYPCVYCASHIVQGKKVRRRSAANVIAEIETLVRDYRIRGFYFCDDLVTGDREWMMEFSRQLAQKNLGLRWACQSRVDYVDEEMLRPMKQAGCVQLDFGVESGSDKTLKTMKKKATADEARAAFALMHRMKMRACATFILGFPGETEDDMEETYRLAREINADYTAFYFLTPYPGTPIYNMAVQNAWIDPKLIADERFTHRQAAVPIMAIEHSPEKLAAIRRRFQNRFFVRNYLRWRNLRFYGSLLWALASSPRDAARALGGFFRTLRLDDFVESVFELHQRRHRARIEVR
ncbi:MAG: B12-binding domain-containing radical SAM protein [Gammaproteobacteria bacterium]|nr:B12-binding domain-containing radical SAM protein [Gammaproteobacteria bacterium]